VMLGLLYGVVLSVVIYWLYWLVVIGLGIYSYHLLVSTFAPSCLQILKCICVHILSWRIILYTLPQLDRV
jgi:hypothetical protein